eukprot:CAMPEP_0119380450 /NCGR_PEP_ID=MMETSP1334-20130426/57032_1 /TAXON_ID=127549 /ORGANISM="Calcidiscus leptoporus, Strain RCC1130" /LENGTH=161 /DNA_ID=CAMNT_0007400283 /DNA_START=504 /DNA_END=989 /DNA_ORIENTATION=+
MSLLVPPPRRSCHSPAALSAEVEEEEALLVRSGDEGAMLGRVVDRVDGHRLLHEQARAGSREGSFVAELVQAAADSPCLQRAIGGARKQVAILALCAELQSPNIGSVRLGPSLLVQRDGRRLVTPVPEQHATVAAARGEEVVARRVHSDALQLRREVRRSA